MIGQTISHYKILEKLGQGGMGVVYKAEDTKLKRFVALKFLPHYLTSDSMAIKRFIQEAQTASALDHQNICTIHEINETEDGQLFIVMTFYDGETLKKKLSMGPLDVKEAIDIAAQICQGLEKAHQNGIIHRDIKPANIMITTDGVVKILDFGLAKLAGTKVTKTGSTLGTVAYMSPEQAAGGDVDFQSDIWSVGVVLYEMLTGQLPFSGDFEQAIIYSILNEEPEPLLNYFPDLPYLNDIIQNCLAKEKNVRYRFASQLYNNIVSVQDATKSTHRLRTINSFSQNHPFLWSRITRLLIVVLIVGFGFLGFYYTFLRQSDILNRSRLDDEGISIAILYFENNTGDEVLNFWRKALSDLLIADLAQSHYFQILSGDKLYNILTKHDLLDVQQYSTDILDLIAREARVNYVLFGNYARAGNYFRISTQLHHLKSSDVITTNSVEGEGENQIFTMVDDLSKKIKSSFSLTTAELAEDVDENVGKITTSSPEALKYYSEGRKLYLAGEHKQSIEMMQKALAIDANFAMAHWSMSQSYAQQGLYIGGYHEKRMQHIEKALSYSDRTSERERLFIEGEYYSIYAKTWERAINAYETLVTKYPYDFDGHKKLGNMYYDIHQWQAAIEQFQYNVDHLDDDPGPYVGMATAYNNLGRFEEACRILSFYRENFKDLAWIHVNLAILNLDKGNIDAARIEVDKAASLPNSDWNVNVLLGDIAIYQGDLETAKKYYDQFGKIDTPAAQQYYTWLLAYLNLHQGKFKDFIKRVQYSIDFEIKEDNYARKVYQYGYLSRFYTMRGDYQKTLLNSKKGIDIAIETDNLSALHDMLAHNGIAYAGLGMFDEAEAISKKLLNSIENSVLKFDELYYYMLMGRLEFFKKNYSSAIDYFNRLRTAALQDDARICICSDILGDIYFETGQFNLAQEKFEEIISLTRPKKFAGDISSQAHYKLAKVYEQKGWEGKAIDQYKKFVELWKDCDPEFRTMIEDAKSRIAVLEQTK